MAISNSTSSYARYLSAAAATFLLGGAVALSLAVVSIQQRWVDWHFAPLLRYQLHKLRTMPQIDVLLVGDSTLGYSIDAAQWSEDLDRPVASVALTGIYGFGGTLNMIRRATRDHAISTVVIMQTPQLAVRPPSYVGYLYTAPELADAFKLPPSSLLQVASSIGWDAVRHGIVSRVFAGPDSAEIVSDYLKQGPPLSSKPEPAPKEMSADAIDLRNFREIRQIAETCSAQRIKCMYVHGPLTNSICKNSDAYFERFAKLMSEAGLKVVLPPTCMPWQDTGDAEDHLIPAKKAEYSRRYMEALRPFLTP